MDITSQNAAGFTTEPVEKVFETLVAKLRESLSKKQYPPTEIDHFLNLVTSASEDPRFVGKSVTAIEHGIQTMLKTHHKETASLPGAEAGSLLKIGKDKILASLPNVVPHGPVSDGRPHVIEQLRDKVANATPHTAAVKAAAHSRFGSHDYLWIGLTALTAGMSIYGAIANYVSMRQSQAANEDGAKQPLPLSAYVIPSAQMALGVGMALVAHNHYKNPTGASL